MTITAGGKLDGVGAHTTTDIAMTGSVTPAPGDDHARVWAALLALQRQSWEQGVAAHAALDLGCVDLVRAMARAAIVRQTAAGKLGEIDDHGTVNCAANGEAVLWLAEADPDSPATEAMQRQREWLLRTCPRAADGTLFHLEGDSEIWTDSVYMLVPLLARLGDVDEAQRQLDGHRRRLCADGSGLYAARWDEATGRLNLTAHWGTGNGWVAAGLARAVHHVGADSSDFARDAAGHAGAVLDACLPYRRPDGLFHDVVDDPSTFVEANLAQMLAYAAFTGVADGWLPDDYADTGRSLLAAARAHIDGDGFVTPVCGSPTFDRPGISAEAQAFFLLASAAATRLEEGQRR